MEIREKLSGLCVCYGRVSTRHDEQAESLENQQALFQHFLEKNPELICTGVYLDQESGKSSERKQFLKMLDRVAAGDVRYILAKDSNRLSRSSEVSGSLNRLCEKTGCKIVYLGSNDIYDPSVRSDRLINNIKSAVAEDYVYQQSELGKLAHIMKCRDRRLSRQNETYGYRFDTKSGKMVIEEKEAAVVRLIFEWYVFENKGVSQIAQDLAKIGVVGARSGKTLTARTITQRLTNPAYIGKMAFNKNESTLVTGVGAKTIRKARPAEEWVYAECPPVISEELFALAQVVREERTRVYKAKENAPAQGRFMGNHLFSAKVFCGACGSSYQHVYYGRDSKVGVYRDSFKQKAHKPDEICENQSFGKIFEDQLIAATLAAINTFIEKHEAVFENAMSLLKQVLTEQECSDSVSQFAGLLRDAQSEKDQWLHAFKEAVHTGDDLLKEECLERFKDASEKVKQLQEVINGKEETQSQLDDLEVRIQRIEDKVKSLMHLDALAREDVITFVERIVIEPTGELRIILTFGETYTVKIESYKDYKKTLQSEESSFVISFFYMENDLSASQCKIIAEQIERGESIEIPMFKIGLLCENKIIAGNSQSCFLREEQCEITVSTVMKL